MFKFIVLFSIMISSAAFLFARAPIKSGFSRLGALSMVILLPFFMIKSTYSLEQSSNLFCLQSSVTLAPLPYAYTALEPHIGEQTLKIHHDKHHARYVDVANTMIKGTELDGKDVITILRAAYGKNQGLFNNAAQVYNHEFYWNCMKANGGGLPTGKLATLIDKYFGSYDKFRTEFINAGMTAFGSGWCDKTL